MDHLEKAPKAYHNLDFMNSPFARPVRLLTEYIEPYARMKYVDIKDTIVFFGSARILPEEQAQKDYEDVKKRYNSAKKNNKLTKKIKDELFIAEQHLQMSKYYEDTVELAYLITKWSKKLKKGNKFVVCSGGGPGIMEAANKGAHKAKGLSMGLNISLPFEQYPNKFITPELNFEFHYFFMRKFWFAYLAKAIIIMPGGYGTLDELMEVLTLVQTNKLRKKMSIVIYGKEFWDKIINLDVLVETNMISKADLNLFKFANTPQEAFNYLKKELSKHYVKS
ncbi:MAG TPA: TIGR00730 family Rossman fold protein [Ignavibacteria bacterium]